MTIERLDDEVIRVMAKYFALTELSKRVFFRSTRRRLEVVTNHHAKKVRTILRRRGYIAWDFIFTGDLHHCKSLCIKDCAEYYLTRIPKCVLIECKEKLNLEPTT